MRKKISFENKTNSIIPKSTGKLNKQPLLQCEILFLMIFFSKLLKYWSCLASHPQWSFLVENTEKNEILDTSFSFLQQIFVFKKLVLSIRFLFFALKPGLAHLVIFVLICQYFIGLGKELFCFWGLHHLKSLELAQAGVAQWIERGLRTKGSPGWFPIRAHAWVTGLVSSTGCARGNHTLMFPSLFLPPFPSL